MRVVAGTPRKQQRASNTATEDAELLLFWSSPNISPHWCCWLRLVEAALRVLSRLFFPSCFSFCPVDSPSRTGDRFCADDAWHRPKAPRRVTGRSCNSFFFFLVSFRPWSRVTVSAMAREIRVYRGCKACSGMRLSKGDQDLTVRNALCT